VISLVAGVLVGTNYGQLEVYSPALPVVALIGLLGILIGDQVVPAVQRLMTGQPVSATWVKKCGPNIFGEWPTNPSGNRPAHRAEDELQA